MDETTYYNHYITIDDRNRVVDRWSTGPHNNRMATDRDVLLTSRGGYQFRLVPNGPENPQIHDDNGIPIYCWDGTQVVARSQEDIDADTLRASVTRDGKLREISAACEAAIIAGIDVNGHHYSLTVNDQANILGLSGQIQAGAPSVLYHADGELCRPYDAAEFMAIATAATAHKTYHTTYCNHLLVWIRRADDADLPSITYGAQLPTDLADSLDALLHAPPD